MANHLASEPIPDSALLFRRIHRIFFDSVSGHVSSGAFDGLEMSVNWNKYATAEETAAQDGSGSTVAVASITAEFCRSLQQTVIHDPLPAQTGAPANRAHALVRGQKSKSVKRRLRDAALLVWKHL